MKKPSALLRWTYDRNHIYSTTGEPAFCTDSDMYTVDQQQVYAATAIASIATGDVRYALDADQWGLITRDDPFDLTQFMQLTPIPEHHQLAVYHPNNPPGTRSLVRWDVNQQAWLFTGQPGNGTRATPHDPTSTQWANAQKLLDYSMDHYGNILDTRGRLVVPAHDLQGRKVQGIPAIRFAAYYQQTWEVYTTPDTRILYPSLFDMPNPRWHEDTGIITTMPDYPTALPVPGKQAWQPVTQTLNGYLTAI